MDEIALLFASEVQKRTFELGRNRTKNMSPADALSYIEKHGKQIMCEVVDELEDYALAIQEYRALKT